MQGFVGCFPHPPTPTTRPPLLQAIWLITTGARESAFRNIKTIAECLADELVNAAKGSSNRCGGACAGACVRRVGQGGLEAMHGWQEGMWCS